MAKPRKCEILVINNIAQVGLKRFPAERYSVVKEAKDPQAILVRSQDLHEFDFGPSLKAVGRAGAGVNNIPVAALSKRGVPVFNAPGANANAVKELVLAGMLSGAGDLVRALEFTTRLETKDLEKRVEDGKKQFAGSELPGGTLGVIGLGKIGSLVADAAIRLGMNVLGHDPHITVEAAWSLPSQVKRAASIDEIFRASQFVSLHVPLGEKTRHLVNAQNIDHFHPEAVLPREAPYRLAIANANVPDMLGRISHALGRRKINIHNMLNKSRGEMAYTLVDADSPVPAGVVDELCELNGVLAVRYLPVDA